MTLFPDVARKKTDIRTLGMYQPFAELMLHGKIETRWRRVDRKLPFPLGRYFLYATQKQFKEYELRALCGSEQLDRIKDTVGNLNNLKTGVAICFATLKKIIPITPDLEDQTFIKHAAPFNGYARFGLVFEDVHPMIQTPFKEGKQGIGFLYEDSLSNMKFRDDV